MFDSIISGMAGAGLHALGAVPLMFWVVLVLAILACIFIVRYITDWHIVVPLVGVFFIISEVMVWRAHWINMGKAEVEEQLAAYKKTNGLVIACYSKNGNQSYLWDRTVGKCLRADGAVE